MAVGYRAEGNDFGYSDAGRSDSPRQETVADHLNSAVADLEMLLGMLDTMSGGGREQSTATVPGPMSITLLAQSVRQQSRIARERLNEVAERLGAYV